MDFLSKLLEMSLKNLDNNIFIKESMFQVLVCSGGIIQCFKNVFDWLDPSVVLIRTVNNQAKEVS